MKRISSRNLRPSRQNHPIHSSKESGDGDSSTDSSDEDNESAPDEEPADENEVTSAVKDKVAEAESEEEPLVDDGEDLGSGDSSAKEALMKKLSSITKSLEDAKNAVLKSL